MNAGNSYYSAVFQEQAPVHLQLLEGDGAVLVQVGSLGDLLPQGAHDGRELVVAGGGMVRMVVMVMVVVMVVMGVMVVMVKMVRIAQSSGSFRFWIWQILVG